MKDLKIILKMIWAVIAGFFIKDEDSEWIEQDIIRRETEHQNKVWLKKFSGKKRYVKCPTETQYY